MRPLFAAAASLVLLAGCGSETPPPGEPIGRFAFTAELDGSEVEGRCAFPSPPTLEFEGILSHEGEKLWLQIGGELREGTLQGAAFQAGLPKGDDGKIRAIPRQLRSCTYDPDPATADDRQPCTLEFLEEIEGTLQTGSPLGCQTPTLSLGETCPGTDDEGNQTWANCGRICGTMREIVRVTPADGCECEVDEELVPLPQSCEIVYTLEADNIGGSR